jgi:hypothetical protein
MTPERLPNETERAFNAFTVFCEVGGSASKVAKQLACCRQNVTRWQKKHRWNERFKAQRQHECEQKIKAEERAVERTAQITEERRAHAAARAFAVGARMIDVADDIMLAHPTSSARLLATGVQTIALVGGAATNYNVPAPTVDIVTQFVGQNGQSVEAPPEITSVEQAEAIIAEYEAKQVDKVAELPCNNWLPDHVDASPTVESTVSPDYREPEKNPDIIPGKPVPSRAKFIPTL